MATVSKPQQLDLGLSQFQELIQDPLKTIRACWPKMVIYDKQAEIIHSLVENDETVVVAGNQLGKDFITSFIVLWFFISRYPCKVVTVAPGETQLETVLWGEMRQLIASSEIKLPIKYNHLACRYVHADGSINPQSILLGLCTNKTENLQGQHLARGPNNAPRTLAVFDEASGVDDKFYTGVDSWSHRRLIIGNPLPCQNFFNRFVEAGDIPHEDEPGYIRKVIKVRGQDSPNVKLAEEEIRQGKEPSHRIIVPGVLSYRDYKIRRKTWDPVRQSVGLDAEFYKGAENLLFPPEWLNHAEHNHDKNPHPSQRTARAIGLDPGEGVEETSWYVVDEYGIMHREEEISTSTSNIVGRTINLLERFGIDPINLLCDSGGGGFAIASLLRDQDINIRLISFGGAPTRQDLDKDLDANHDDDSVRRKVYKNKRAEMYGELSDLLDMTVDDNCFGIPEQETELRRQLAPVPKLYDGEGKLYLPPKDKPNPNYKGPTIKQMIGCSPNRADALVLATHGLLHPAEEQIIGRPLF